MMGMKNSYLIMHLMNKINNRCLVTYHQVSLPRREIKRKRTKKRNKKKEDKEEK
jgi:hypothetical protein